MLPSTPTLASTLPWLILGSALSYFVGWEPNLLIAGWLVPAFLMHFTRRVPRAWQAIAFPMLGLTVTGWFTVRGAWHMGAPAELFFAAVMAVPLTGSLLADRLLHRRLGAVAATLVFPSTWVCFDFAYSHMYGLGDVFSPALTQFRFAPLLQLVSVTGIYGITFMMGWFGAVAVAVAHDVDDLSRWRAPVSAFSATALLIAIFGSARLSVFDHEVPTVRVASIVVPHATDYHAEIIDERSPRAEAARWLPELAALEEDLFAASERAAIAGARIVMWSETAAVLYEDHEAAYLERASAFARTHGIYLQTAALIAKYDSEKVDNQLTLFTPDGSVAYSYLKTQTWYPTESDGIVHSADTPYGRLSGVICFDLDTPSWMRQVAALDVDILLVPGFDTLAISPYHTESGLFRAVEGGYNLVRGVNDGTSMVVDTRGQTLALQDSFRTHDPILFADVPTRGTTTVYGLVGDWVPLLCGLMVLVLAWRGWRRGI